MPNKVTSTFTNWKQLNDALKDQSDEKVLQSWLNDEILFNHRKQFALRIHSRLNKVRADRERTEILEKVHAPQIS